MVRNLRHAFRRLTGKWSISLLFVMVFTILMLMPLILLNTSRLNSHYMRILDRERPAEVLFATLTEGVYDAAEVDDIAKQAAQSEHVLGIYRAKAYPDSYVTTSSLPIVLNVSNDLQFWLPLVSHEVEIVAGTLPSAENQGLLLGAALAKAQDWQLGDLLPLSISVDGELVEISLPITGLYRANSAAVDSPGENRLLTVAGNDLESLGITTDQTAFRVFLKEYDLIDDFMEETESYVFDRTRYVAQVANFPLVGAIVDAIRASNLMATPIAITLIGLYLCAMFLFGVFYQRNFERDAVILNALGLRRREIKIQFGLQLLTLLLIAGVLAGLVFRFLEQPLHSVWLAQFSNDRILSNHTEEVRSLFAAYQDRPVTPGVLPSTLLIFFLGLIPLAIWYVIYWFRDVAGVRVSR